MSDTKLLVISNRLCQPQCGNEDLFGQGFNPAGSCALRLATADFDQRTRRWRLDLLPDTNADPDNVCQASTVPFKPVLEGIARGDLQAEKWVFLVPGYTSTCLSGLEQARQLQEHHGVNVILFSWPADPRDPVGQGVSSYRRTQQAAVRSALALDRVLSSLEKVFVEPARKASRRDRFRFSLLAHSLGNYVIQKWVQTAPIDQGKTFKFDNVILHQPDVDFKGCQIWINAMAVNVRRYVTTNQMDIVLRIISDLVNPMRLGQASHGVASGQGILHVDFSKARHANGLHWFFGDAIDNQIIRTYCTRVVQGELGENGLYPDPNEPGRYQAIPFDPFPPFTL